MIPPPGVAQEAQPAQRDELTEKIAAYQLADLRSMAHWFEGEHMGSNALLVTAGVNRIEWLQSSLTAARTRADAYEDEIKGVAAVVEAHGHNMNDGCNAWGECVSKLLTAAEERERKLVEALRAANETIDKAARHLRMWLGNCSLNKYSESYADGLAVLLADRSKG